jgi:NAD(P)-dependent dehydrogenase (short-subunit alcohol dehydrogenase family)
LARDGAKVALVDVDAAVEGAARELGHSVEVVALRADVSSATDVDRCFHEVVARWQRLDILVNNAAITRGSVRHFLEGDEAWWDEVVGVNLKGQFLCARRAAPLMAAQGSGVIINMSSGGATRAHRGMAAYDASKGGSEALTRALALDLAPYGVRVVAIAPGLISPRRTIHRLGPGRRRHGAARAHGSAGRHRRRGRLPGLRRRRLHHRGDDRRRRRTTRPAALAASRDIPSLGVPDAERNHRRGGQLI